VVCELGLYFVAIVAAYGLYQVISRLCYSYLHGFLLGHMADVHHVLFTLLLCELSMDHNRQWNCLSWNVRGINYQLKWDAIRNIIKESRSSIICIQETKRKHFDATYLIKFCPNHLNCLEFSPSVGALGGLITIWIGNMFEGSLVSYTTHSITVKLTSKIFNQSFHVTNIYGPADSVEKPTFISWIYNLDATAFDDWILMGDFNLIRPPPPRTKAGQHSNPKVTFIQIRKFLD
jgi:exonuclease III